MDLKINKIKHHNVEIFRLRGFVLKKHHPPSPPAERDVLLPRKRDLRHKEDKKTSPPMIIGTGVKGSTTNEKGESSASVALC